MILMAVLRTEYSIPSKTGLADIFARCWAPSDKEPTAIFQIAHGMAEHSERYADFAEYLCSKGFVVIADDHIGHGKSVECLDDLGFTAEEDGDLRMIDDMHILYSIMHKRYPELPYYLFGHSMGSFCARVYATSFWNELSGLILCGTGELPSAAVVFEEPIRLLCKKLGARASVPAALLDKFQTLWMPGAKTSLDWLSQSEENIENGIAYRFVEYKRV